jgi:hypothetical protein
MERLILTGTLRDRDNCASAAGKVSCAVERVALVVVGIIMSSLGCEAGWGGAVEVRAMCAQKLERPAPRRRVTQGVTAKGLLDINISGASLTGRTR